MSHLIPLIPQPSPNANKVLLLAHRTELLNQAQNQILRYNPKMNVQIEQGKRQVDMALAEVIVASVPTIGRQNSAKIENYDPSQFKAILIDEAHHATASTYINILSHFNALDPESNILVWGCSATIRRHDGISLGSVFEKVVYHSDFLNMIEEGHLCQMRVTTVKTYTDLSDVGSSRDDFKQADLANAVNTPARNKIIMNSWKLFADEKGRKSTLVFAVDVEHTKELCNMFRKEGIAAEFITAKTPAIERHQILKDFAAGKFPVLVNCAILTEGTDIPNIDCILMARPTRSSTLFQQMFGRGLRKHEGKEDCLVIDYVDSFHRTGPDGLVTIPTLLGLNIDTDLEGADILDLKTMALESYNIIDQMIPGNEINASAEEDGSPENPFVVHQYDKASTLLDEEVDEEVDDLASSLIRIRVTEYDSVNEVIDSVKTSPEIRKASSLAWVSVGPNKCILQVLSKGNMTLKKVNGIWEGRFAYANSDWWAKPSKPLFSADSLTSAIHAADTWLRHELGHQSLFASNRNARFRYAPMTTAQRDLISKYNIKVSNDMTKGQAIDLITKLKYGQVSVWKDRIKSSIEQKQKRQKLLENSILGHHIKG
ncbi:P-loop containing nucleoside triphosphate hydrolase protein [Pilobolus umbonatus]|nr:P-loop containing nucleoside triphosphate hydrolase protein [Pilobolus umbonatus]